jgi:hypothetical protein
MSAYTTAALDRFRDRLLLVDPALRRYATTHKGNYTCWREYGARSLSADNRFSDRVWRVQVDRFTKVEDDPLIPLISAALDCDWITHSYTVDYERDAGYIHHIWDCEVV